MDKTAQLIKSISESAEPVKRSRSPLGIFLIWLACSTIYEIILVFIFGLRPDLNEKLNSPEFIAELALLSAIVITAGLSAIHLSFPDDYQLKWLPYLPLLPFIGLAILLYNMWLKQPPIVTPIEHGIECLICVAIFSSFSALAIMYLLRKQAAKHYYLTGAIAFLASSSLGALVFGLCEPIDSVTHLVIWHYLPMLGFMALGMVFGRNFIRL